jgi:hypothetical protein
VASNRRFFLVERYLPSISARAVGSAVDRLHRSGPGARHLWSVLVTDEETCLSVFEAADPGAIGAANATADFRVDRIVEVELFPAPTQQERRAR